jgi:hypothetical protein
LAAISVENAASASIPASIRRRLPGQGRPFPGGEVGADLVFGDHVGEGLGLVRGAADEGGDAGEAGVGAGGKGAEGGEAAVAGDQAVAGAVLPGRVSGRVFEFRGGGEDLDRLAEAAGTVVSQRSRTPAATQAWPQKGRPPLRRSGVNGHWL